MELVRNPPRFSHLLRSARSFGNYDLSAAIADLVDNSIFAEADKINIHCEFLGGKPEIRIRDNGCGMSKTQLIDAMRTPNRNPEDDREAGDLGRFGWGMKTASLSQCSRMTVVTLKNKKTFAASWDVDADDIDDYSMALYSDTEASELLRQPFLGSSGTEVIWQNCDRFSEGHTIDSNQFNEIITATGRQLALIFHRYLSGGQGLKKLRISINNTSLEAVDPFHSQHVATQPLPTETISILNSKISMKAYILPHHSKLERSEYEVLGGADGYIKNQGFYVYRQKRLIIHGTWFRLAKLGELSQLVRIRVDIPNNLDTAWKITLDKSDAQLPSQLKERMRKLIDKFRKQSVKVYRGRVRVPGNSGISVWNRTAGRGKIRYVINREHPLVKSLNKKLDKKKKESLSAFIESVENGFPVETLFVDTAADPQNVIQHLINRDEIRDFIWKTLPVMLGEGKDYRKKLKEIRKTEPYSENLEILDEVLLEMGIG